VTKYAYAPTGRERHFGKDEVIVSKTDPKGKITYGNDVFERMAGYSEAEYLGAPHSILRHPDMPRCVFKLLWDRISAGDEVFAYVKNMAKGGDHYWVFAHVTPTYDASNKIVSYHSNRRCPDPEQVAKVEPIYKELLAIEAANGGSKDGMAKAAARLGEILKGAGLSYDEFIFAV